MNQIAQPLSAGRWVGRVIVGVLVAEGVWGLIVSLTRDLIVPFLARQMGEVSQAPQNVNVQGIFSAVIALCLAGLVAVILNVWVNRPAKPPRVKTVPVGGTAERAASSSLSIAPEPPAPVVSRAPAPAPAPAAASGPAMQTPTAVPVAATRMTQPPVPEATKPAPSPAPAPVTAKPSPPAPPPKPAKPKPPKEIQYNIVGEPISPMEEDE